MSTMKIAGLLTLLSLFVSSNANIVRGAEKNEITSRKLTIKDYKQCMQDLSSMTEWPIPESDRVDTGRIDSAFGPVHSLCLDQDIFHKGIAVFGDPTDPVNAPYEGTVAFANDVCVVIEHKFKNQATCTFHDDEVNVWYSLFMGMQDIIVSYGNPVQTGEQIGSVGRHSCKDGTHERTTVEYQVRIGSRFSMKAAEKMGYSQTYDPSVNPLLAHPNLHDPHVVANAMSHDGGGDVMVEVKTMDDEPDVNRYEVECDNDAAHILDLSLRLGFVKDDALAPFNKNKPYLDAQPFGNMRTHWTGHLIIPEGWMAGATKCSVRIYDIWDTVKAVHFDYPL